MNPYAMHNPPDDVERILAVRMMEQAIDEAHAPAVASLEAIKRRVAVIVEGMK